MATVLIVDDMAIFREPIVAALRVAGYEAIGAESAREALDLLDIKKPDLMLLDVAMPAMDGLTCLGVLRTNPRWNHLPVIMLTAIADKNYVMQASILGVKDYLVKSYFSLDQLLRVIEQSLAEVGKLPAKKSAQTHNAQIVKESPRSPEGAELSKRESILAKLRRAQGLKTLSGSIQATLTLTRDSEGSADQLVKIIGRDAVLSTRVLQMANSAAYGSNRELVTNLHQAVLMIGFGAVRNIALSIGVHDALPAQARDGFDGIRCWEHCFAVARIMDLTIPDLDVDTKSVNHLIGLCHDIPELIIRQTFADEYAEIAEFSGETTLSFDEVTEMLWEVSYSEIVAAILGAMNLPTSIVTPICQFFAFERQNQSEGLPMSRSVQALQVANLLAHGLLAGPSRSVRVSPFTLEHCRRALGTSDLPLLVDSALRNEIHSTTSILARLSPEDQVRFETPLFPMIERNVLYVRPGEYSELDPLSLALSQLVTKLEICASIPTDGEQLSQFSAMVIVKGAGQPLEAILRAVSEAQGRSSGRLECLVLSAHNVIPDSVPSAVQLETLPISLSRFEEFLRR